MKVPTIDPDEMLNSVDAAAYLDITPERIYALRRQGRIGMMIGGFWVFSKAELDNYKATRKRGRPKGYKPPPRKSRTEKES